VIFEIFRKSSETVSFDSVHPSLASITSEFKRLFRDVILASPLSIFNLQLFKQIYAIFAASQKKGKKLFKQPEKKINAADLASQT